MTEPELVHLSDVGYHEFDREMIRRTRGGTVVERDGLLLVAGPNTTPFVVNAAMRLDQRLSARPRHSSGSTPSSLSASAPQP